MKAAAACAAACVIGVTPIGYALDQLEETNDLAQPALQLVDERPLRYPRAALKRDLEGVCHVAFDVAPNGRAANVRVTSCSSRLFRAEAVRYARSLRYAARPSGTGPVPETLTIRWIDEDAGRTLAQAD